MNLTVPVRLSKKGQLVIPKTMRQVLGINEGDGLLVTLEGKSIVLTRPQDFARATRGLLKGTWGKSRGAIERYLQRERRSWR